MVIQIATLKNAFNHVKHTYFIIEGYSRIIESSKEN